MNRDIAFRCIRRATGYSTSLLSSSFSCSSLAPSRVSSNTFRMFSSGCFSFMCSCSSYGVLCSHSPLVQRHTVSSVCDAGRHFSLGSLFSSQQQRANSSSPTTTDNTCASKETPPTSSSTSLLREEALEPLQDRLLDTCVKILEMCGGYADGRPPLKEIDNASRDVLFDLVDAVLHDYNKSPAEQFDLLYAALCLPAAQKYAFLRTPLLTIMECVVPQPFYQYLRGVDVFLPDYDEESIIRRESLLRFGRVLLGDLEFLQQVGQVEGEEGKENTKKSGSSSFLSEEVVVELIVEDFKKCFPNAIRVPAFEVLEKNALTIALQSKLYALLGRLCMELDPERSGRIALKDLEDTARRVLGKEKARSLLESSEKVVDAEGKLRYRQLCALLSRGRSPSATTSNTTHSSSSSPAS